MAEHEPVALYLCPIGDFVGLPGGGLLPPRRAAAMDAFKQPKDKARCLVAGLLLRHVFGVAGCAGMRYNEYGKPYWAEDSRHFSLSHAGDFVVLAVADAEIGADIEPVRPYEQAVAQRVFTPAECDWLAQQTGDEGFYRLWTAKESVMKGAGLGFALPPEDFSVLPVGGGPHEIAGRTWHFGWLNTQGHVVCVAAPRPPDVTVAMLGRGQLYPE